MLQQSDYLKLTSFTDVINHDFRPCFLLPANCGKLLNDSTDMNTRRSVDQAIWVNLAEKNTGDIFDMLKQNRYVSILDDSAYASVKTYGCLYEKEEEDKKPLILSEMPIYKHILGIAINKFAPKSVNDVITKGSYAATEFGLFEHDRVKK
uniref:Uncharacterized protein n=1 Tax=Tetranychus urticae TaxID=32264 RepID=T1KBB6_TETUR